jgi:hypothetical protein
VRVRDGEVEGLPGAHVPEVAVRHAATVVLRGAGGASARSLADAVWELLRDGGGAGAALRLLLREVGRRRAEDPRELLLCLRGLGPADVLQERRDGDRGQHAEDDHYDHQLDQREALDFTPQKP